MTRLLPVIANRLPIQDERDIAWMWQAYYGAIDALFVSLQERFNQEEFSLDKTIEDFYCIPLKKEMSRWKNLS